MSSWLKKTDLGTTTIDGIVFDHFQNPPYETYQHIDSDGIEWSVWKQKQGIDKGPYTMPEIPFWFATAAIGDMVSPLNLCEHDGELIRSKDPLFDLDSTDPIALLHGMVEYMRSDNDAFGFGFDLDMEKRDA